MAKRIALYSISTAASKYKKVIKPLLSFNADFYIRLFLIVKDSPEDCKNNAFKYGYLYHCRNCQNRFISPMAKLENIKKRNKTINKFKFNNLTGNISCNVCDSYMCMSGPYWIEDMQDEDFINNILNALDKDNNSYLKYNKRIKNFLLNIKDEQKLKSQVFSYDYSRFSSDLTLSCPKMSLIK
jgi:tRNA (guanine26-N2/guanine27-N2)-dimethyltransferase